MLTEQEIAKINEILSQKRDVEIQCRSSGIAIISVRKDVKYLKNKSGKAEEKCL